MQKLYLKNKWNKDLEKFHKDSFEIKESEYSLSGRVLIKSKIKEKFISKDIPFIAFKSKITNETIDAIKSGEFNADYILQAESFTPENQKELIYFKMIINHAEPVKKNNFKKEQEENVELFIDDEIPF